MFRPYVWRESHWLGLGVLAPLVPGEPRLIRGSVAAARHVAGVGALTSVHAHVRRESATRLRAVPTARHVAGVGALASVHAHVPLEVATLLRAIPTARRQALKWPLPRVRAQVSIKTALPACGVPTPGLCARLHARHCGSLCGHRQRCGLGLTAPASRPRAQRRAQATPQAQAQPLACFPVLKWAS